MADDVLTLVDKYKRRHTALSNERAMYLPIWRDIRDFLAPRTARFPGERVQRTTREDLNIINTSPRFAVRALPSGMQSGITSPMRPWFRLGLPNPDMQEFKPFKIWLHRVEYILREIMARSNIYDRLKSFYGTLGTYGTSALFIDDDAEDIIRAHEMPMGSFMISTNAAGRVDTAYRDLSMTCVQMISKFGMERVPKNVKQQYDRGDYEERMTLCHIVEPNRMFKPASALSQHKRFASIYLDKERSGREAILQFTGYDEMPVLCPRWDVYGEDAWGVGCGEVALGDAKQLQLMEKRKLQGIDKNVNPPMIADASMRNQRHSILPGDTTYVNGLITGRPGFQRAYDVNPYINELREENMRVEERINEAFFKNLFLMVAEIADQPNITATQINAMREEKLLMLGPVLERLNDEALDPCIDRVFAIAARRGLLPPPPEEIQNMPLRVEYISVLAQAQKAIGIGNIERFVGFVGNMAQVKPEALDKLNTDEIIDEYADGVAMPPKGVHTNEEVQQIRQQRAQAEAQAQQMQAGMGAAAAGTDIASTVKALSETSMQGDTALTRAMGIAP